MGIRYNTSIVTNGLIFGVDAANVKSYPGTGTSAFSLNNNTAVGTLTSSAMYSDNSFVFTGNNTIDFGNNSILDITNNLTVNCWVKFPIGYGNAGWNGIFAKRTSTSTNYGLNVNTTTDVIQLYFNSGAGFRTLQSPLTSNFTPNQWVNITGVYQSSALNTNLFLYKNGVLFANTNVANNVGLSSANLYLGMTAPYVGEYWPGTLANLFIYNRVLSVSEIRQNYNAFRGRFGL